MPSKMTRAQALEFLDRFGPWPTSVLATAEPATPRLLANSVDLRAGSRRFVAVVTGRMSNVFGSPVAGVCLATVPTAEPLPGVPALGEDFDTGPSSVAADPDEL